jgi:hypothetical protein
MVKRDADKKQNQKLDGVYMTQLLCIVQWADLYH